MANPEHLEILRQGVEVWNDWREEHPEIEPDLSGAKLRRANLRRANLQRVDLYGARLDRADFEVANLHGARLGSASFIGTNLQRAILADADLSGANLAEANVRVANLQSAFLGGANLILTDLYSTNLGDAWLGEARIGSTTIVNVDLSQTRGLQRVVHDASSGIATSTLERTASGLARDPSRQSEIEAFYRGAGVEEHLIKYFRSQIDQPIEFYSCFVSYSHADASIAGRLYAALQERGIRCWKDSHDLKPGGRILDEVGHAIEKQERILLFCSQAALNSWWVNDEIRKALERERRDGRDIIIPLMLDRYLLDGWEDGMAADLRSRLAADFTGWEHDNAKFEEQFERVVRALRTGEGRWRGRRSRISRRDLANLKKVER